MTPGEVAMPLSADGRKKGAVFALSPIHGIGVFGLLSGAIFGYLVLIDTILSFSPILRVTTPN
jgi:hypothetical protein